MVSSMSFMSFDRSALLHRPWAFAGAEVGLTVDHPGDRGRTVLTPAARRLAEDLA
jgi:hypothetical protein